MKWFILLTLHLSIFGFAQIVTPNRGDRTDIDADRRLADSIQALKRLEGPADSLKIYNPTIGDYNYWTLEQSKRVIDTALTIDTYYAQNVYRQDLFAYLQFPNLGQALQSLEPQIARDNHLLPTGKSFMYTPNEEVKYFDVKTPMTEFVFENGVEEGQYLSTTFAHNIHSRLNYAINYDYLKSQGRYLNSLANNSKIILSSNYRTKNNRYHIRGNFVTHDLNNEENGGLTDESIIDFIIDNPNFSNRERMYINLDNTQTKYDERRFYLEHKFGLFSFGKRKDSITSNPTNRDGTFPIYIKHSISYKHQAYQYEENTTEDYYNSLVLEGNRYNRKKFDLLENHVSLGYQWSNKLNIDAGLIHQIMELYYDQALELTALTIPESVNDNRIGVQGRLNFNWKENIHLSASGLYIKGDTFGDTYNFNAQTRIIPFKNYLLTGGVQLRSSFPSINLYNNQSFYTDFNYNNATFDNQTSQELFATLSSQRWGLTIYGSLINANNYIYIDSDYTPKQATDALNYYKIGAREHYKYKKFGLDVQAQYQQVIENQEILPIPDFIARASLYYDTWAFKNHAHIQTGISSSYFSNYDAQEFFPVLNEFYLNNTDREIGNYPKTDIFFNIKVDRMRIYLRGENINSFFQTGEYFSTPLRPARDFKLQVGIHWFLFS